MLRDRGRKGADRRSVVDMAAAVVILQHALDTERTSGAAPGELVQTDPPVDGPTEGVSSE
jgi:putative Holliday junction resolvase